jgi:hypothetical protein
VALLSMLLVLFRVLLCRRGTLPVISVILAQEGLKEIMCLSAGLLGGAAAYSDDQEGNLLRITPLGARTVVVAKLGGVLRALWLPIALVTLARREPCYASGSESANDVPQPDSARPSGVSAPCTGRDGGVQGYLVFASVPRPAQPGAASVGHLLPHPAHAGRGVVRGGGAGGRRSDPAATRWGLPLRLARAWYYGWSATRSTSSHRLSR